MTTAIASQLISLLDSDTEVIPWEQVDAIWKEKVERACLSDTFPSYLIYPQTLDALAKIVQYAHENKLSILPCGNGSKLSWGGLVRPQLVVSSQRLNHIIDHAVGDLTVTVEAGVTLKQLETCLQPYAQFLPLDPAYPDTATMGGIMATADAGSWRQRYGGVREMVLGLSFVRFDGKIAKAGGRVVKNVAGYDLMKLFTGSYGTLGIITQITFRLYPMAEASQTMLITGEAEAIATIATTVRQSGLTPTAAEILSASMVQSLGSGQGMGLLLRFQSIQASITEQINQVKQMTQLLNIQSRFYLGQEETKLWQQLQKRITVPCAETEITCKIGVIPSAAVAFLTQLNQLGLGMVNLSSGLGKLAIQEGDLKKLRSLCQTDQGFLSVLESPKSVKQSFEPWGYNGNTLQMMQTIKQQFDPNYIFSPHRFIGHI